MASHKYSPCVLSERPLILSGCLANMKPQTELEFTDMVSSKGISSMCILFWEPHRLFSWGWLWKKLWTHPIWVDQGPHLGEIVNKRAEMRQVRCPTIGSPLRKLCSCKKRTFFRGRNDSRVTGFQWQSLYGDTTNNSVLRALETCNQDTHV